MGRGAGGLRAGAGRPFDAWRGAARRGQVQRGAAQGGAAQGGAAQVGTAQGGTAPRGAGGQLRQASFPRTRESMIGLASSLLDGVIPAHAGIQ